MNTFSLRALGAAAPALFLAAALAASPAQAQQDPLVGVNLGPAENLQQVTIPGTPGRYCHWLEKSNDEIELRGSIADAVWNAMQWDHLAYDLKQLRRELQARRSSDPAQAALDQAALARINAAIAAAEAQVKAADDLEARLRARLDAVLKAPVNACGVPNTESIGFIPGTKFDELGGHEPQMRPVNIPNPIPLKVCHEEDKTNLVEQTATARDNAFRNLGDWQIRAAQLDQAIRAGHPNAATMEKALHEAKMQIELWEMELKKAADADARANAIEVVDCTKTADSRLNTTGNLLGSLTKARQNHHAADQSGQWGVAGQTGNLAHVGHAGGAFDGSEAELGLREQMAGGLGAGHMPQRSTPAQPVQDPIPSAPGHTFVDPQPQPPVEEDAPDTALDLAGPVETVIASAPQTSTPPAPAYPDCPTHPGQPGSPEHIEQYHS